MSMDFRCRKACAVLLGQALMASIAVQAAIAQQEAPLQEPAASNASMDAATPNLAVPPAADGSEVLPVPATTREGALEDRIRQLETMVKTLSGQVQQLKPAGGNGGAGNGNGNGGTGEGPGPNPGSGDTGSAANLATPSASGGAAAPGQSPPPNPSPSARFNSPTTLQNVPGKSSSVPASKSRATTTSTFSSSTTCPSLIIAATFRGARIRLTIPSRSLANGSCLAVGSHDPMGISSRSRTVWTPSCCSMPSLISTMTHVFR